MGKIIRCVKCKDEITSYHRHDFKWCKCHSIHIDGGDDYWKVGGEKHDIEVWSEEHEVWLPF